MPCDTRLKRGQTIQQRVAEVKKVVSTLSSALAAGRVKAKVGPQGAITFIGLTDEERDNVTDNCAFRRLMATGSPMALLAIAKAEALAGRKVDKQVVAQGGHYHGDVYHEHKG